MKRYKRVGVAAMVAVVASPLGGVQAQQAPRFNGTLLVASDVDMAATAYVDGKLEPVPGARDALSVLTFGPDGARVAATPASNSVVSWPEIIAASPDGRRAFVVETRGPAAPGVAEVGNVYTDLPVGRRLQAFDVSDPAGPRLTSEVQAGENLQSVSVSPDGRWVVVASQANGGEAVFYAVDDAGRLQGRRAFALRPPVQPDDEDGGVRTLHWGPRDILALQVSDRRVQFYRLDRAADGSPQALTSHGQPVEAGRELSIGKWTPDGRFFLVTDTNWASSQFHMLTQGPGTITSITVDPSAAAAHRIAGRARVGRSPEGISLSDDGRWLVATNMERTYLPEFWFLNWWPGRSRYSLSLVEVDTRTGALTTRGRPVFAEGILPEDAVFDRGGQNIAVAVFHRRRGPDRRKGFIDFFSVRQTSDGPRLVRQAASVEVPRGPHDLVRLP